MGLIQVEERRSTSVLVEPEDHDIIFDVNTSEIAAECIKIRAGVRLKFLIAINLAIKKVNLY